MRYCTDILIFDESIVDKIQSNPIVIKIQNFINKIKRFIMNFLKDSKLAKSINACKELGGEYNKFISDNGLVGKPIPEDYTVKLIEIKNPNYTLNIKSQIMDYMNKIEAAAQENNTPDDDWSNRDNESNTEEEWKGIHNNILSNLGITGSLDANGERSIGGFEFGEIKLETYSQISEFVSARISLAERIRTDIISELSTFDKFKERIVKTGVGLNGAHGVYVVKEVYKVINGVNRIYADMLNLCQGICREANLLYNDGIDIGNDELQGNIVPETEDQSIPATESVHIRFHRGTNPIFA